MCPSNNNANDNCNMATPFFFRSGNFLDSSDGDVTVPTYEELQKLEYMGMVLKETLRYFVVVIVAVVVCLLLLLLLLRINCLASHYFFFHYKHMTEKKTEHRLYPPAPLLNRVTAVEGEVIAGYKVPKGVSSVCHFFAHFIHLL